MLRASALYIVIVIALVIGLLCSSLIVAAFFYRSEYLRKFRYDELENNVSSGINILLADQANSYATERKFGLFDNEVDSVSLTKIAWGIYDIGVSRAFIQKDTLTKIFSQANAIDSSKWCALYLMNEDRPFSLSGKTRIRGDAYIPEAGVKEAYIDNVAYQGDKRLIIGTKRFSDKKLPSLNISRLEQLQRFFNRDEPADDEALQRDTIKRSFLLTPYSVSFKKNTHTISHAIIDGNIILLSDTTLILDSTTFLNNTLVFAPSIIIKSGFHGIAQFFATDSIRIDSNCRFNYPSCLGVIRFKPSKVSSQAKITLGKNSVFNGVIFSYEKNEQPVKPLIAIGTRSVVKGQVYSQGILELDDKSEIDGSVFTARFLYKNRFTLYENYLINTTIDSKELSSYYLTSDLLPVSKNQKKVLQWLGTK